MQYFSSPGFKLNKKQAKYKGTQQKGIFIQIEGAFLIPNETLNF